MKTKILMIGLFLIGFAFTSQAQSAPPSKVKKTQIKQQKRIKDGVKDGELTRKEAKALALQQKQIQKAKKKAAKDGKVTRKEKAIIKKKQARASKDIHQLKNNRADRQ